jgi:hypothetical protein
LLAPCLYAQLDMVDWIAAFLTYLMTHCGLNGCGFVELRLINRVLVKYLAWLMLEPFSMLWYCRCLAMVNLVSFEKISGSTASTWTRLSPYF